MTDRLENNSHGFTNSIRVVRPSSLQLERTKAKVRHTVDLPWARGDGIITNNSTATGQWGWISKTKIWEENLKVAKAGKAYFIETVSRYADENIDLKEVFRELYPKIQPRNRSIHYTYSRNSVKPTILKGFWNNFLSRENIVSMEKSGYSFSQQGKKIFVRNEWEWTYTIHIPRGVTIEEDRVEKIRTTKPEETINDPKQGAESIREAKQEFCNILENLLSSKEQKAGRGQGWVRKPDNFHLKFNWDIGFNTSVDPIKETIKLTYKSWYPLELNYGKDALRVLREEALEWSGCTFSGYLEKRILRYSATNGWKVSLSLA